MAIRRADFKRPAAIVLETIVALPVLVIALLAVVQFGMLSSGQSSLQRASRAGADRATQVTLSAVTIPLEVIDAVTAVLDCNEISVEGIRLEYRLDGAPPVVLTSGSGCAAPVTPPPASRDYVRVSVCAQNTQLAPNLLSTYCVDMSGKTSQKSTTRCL